MVIVMVYGHVPAEIKDELAPKQTKNMERFNISLTKTDLIIVICTMAVACIQLVILCIHTFKRCKHGLFSECV